MIIPENKKYISFFGSIGVGKTTAGRIMQNFSSNVVFVEEDLTENSYLSRFYNNMKEWGFLSTLEMLLLMANQFDKANNNNNNIVILDNGIHELICYAQLEHEMGILTSDQFITYKRLYKKLLQLTPNMNLYVFFHCDERTQMERIMKRNRYFEQNISLDFISRLNNYYRAYVHTLPQDKLIYVDTSTMVDFENLLRQIEDGV